MKATSEEMMIFVAVVESGSFSRAAERLGQANSAISRAIKKLESKLGVNLLNRTTRQLSLTEEGERYFRRIQGVLQEMAAAETEVMEAKLTPRGVLRIDAATPVMLHFVMPMIKPFRERYPEITLSLVSSETFINLIERKVDVAIRVGKLTDSSLRARPIFTSYRKLIASPDYLARYGVPETAEDLKNHTCLGFTEPVSLNTWPVAAQDGQLYEIDCDISSNSGETLKHLCLNGNGIASLSDFMIAKELESGELVEVLASKRLPVETPFSAVYYSDRAVSTRIRAFIDFISEYLS
ncbi:MULTISPECIES: DNA-binding transcriptional regulator YafC [Enterobacteriaceae]|jgi:DNA-binding transcriptional LysR family regulator|uniref:DNA-binding transcriptional regulator YafC n=1 Tax=Citrobacter bitternis TaxID=1585982 RepID=A0ABW1Q3P5_9ENTR|nr:DNA-binding transcriptional regulator YafC [Phytobacter sp. SCO41]AUU89457.1 LysR family transcriptional regulator [Enterobacteriaceae bacterium ENNIH3]AUV05207.1 LysR family transcriptional regulator [Enterobacteriaceae bacterium ENNIH2]MDU4999833.1 DNA-binding transcriptional regulator YafC [Enterobacteriaceae bacterium]PWF52072.1 LysR family transcriptional regulator [[Kluyvera] intestini]TCW42070.1 LysR family transcriptional regulator [Phytobacter diazotrophicus]